MTPPALGGPGGTDDPDRDEQEEPSWELAPTDNLAEASLDDVVREAAVQPVRLDDEDSAQIALREAPVGFRGILRLLAQELRTSYSRLVRAALDHGMALLGTAPEVIALEAAYDLATAAAMSRGDRDALAQLNQVSAYEFQHPQKFRTTLAVSKKTSSRISDLAIACGIPRPHLAVLAVIVSVLTLPNNRLYRDVLHEEVDAFMRFVVWRRRVLALGRPDQPGPGPRRGLT